MAQSTIRHWHLLTSVLNLKICGKFLHNDSPAAYWPNSIFATFGPDKEDLADIWHALSTDEPTRVRDRAIIALLSHGLRASELSVLNVNHWNGKRLTVHRSKG